VENEKRRIGIKWFSNNNFGGRHALYSAALDNAGFCAMPTSLGRSQAPESGAMSLGLWRRESSS
jgi:hypothetical protein